MVPRPNLFCVPTHKCFVYPFVCLLARSFVSLTENGSSSVDRTSFTTEEQTNQETVNRQKKRGAPNLQTAQSLRINRRQRPKMATRPISLDRSKSSHHACPFPIRLGRPGKTQWTEFLHCPPLLVLLINRANCHLVGFRSPSKMLPQLPSCSFPPMTRSVMKSPNSPSIIATASGRSSFFNKPSPVPPPPKAARQHSQPTTPRK